MSRLAKRLSALEGRRAAGARDWSMLLEDMECEIS